MTAVRRAGAAALVSLVLVGFTAVPVRAQTETETIVTAPEQYIASAAARALYLELLGTSVTVGSTGALIDSSPKAQAQGAGVLLIGDTVADAAVTGSGPQGDDPAPACVLNLPLGLLNLAAACGDAQVAIDADDRPTASATGGVASIELGLSLLDPLIDQLLALVGNTIGAVTDPLTALLGGLLDPLLGALELDVTNLVDDLVAGLQRATGVLRVQVGTSGAETVTTAESVLATAVAEGGRVDVLPGLTLTGEPLLSIIVGSARAAIELTRPDGAGVATPATVVPTFDPAIVTVRLGLPLLGGLTEIPVGLGAPLTLLEGTPLESTISLGAGEAVVNDADGTATAVADGVSLALLKGIGGGIVLELAHAEVAGGGRSAVITTRTIQPPQVEPEPQILARTGGTPTMPMLGFGLVLVALTIRRAVLSRS